MGIWECPITVSQKVTLAYLVELEVVDFNIILGMDQVRSFMHIFHFQFPDKQILE